MADAVAPDDSGVPVPGWLETPRLVLRAADPAMAAELNAAVVESLDTLRPWMDWAQAAPTAADTRAFLEDARAASAAGRGFEFCAVRRADARLVGTAGLADVDRGAGACEVGYWVRRSDAGRGYATEAIAALTALAFGPLGLARVEARVAEGNAASERVLTRLGFAPDPGRRRVGPLADGRPGAMRTWTRRAPGWPADGGVPVG